MNEHGHQGQIDRLDKRHRDDRIRAELERLVPEGAVVFTDHEGRIGLLFSWLTTGLIETLFTQLNRTLPFLITVGVGKPCTRLSEVHMSYTQAELALKHKFYRGEGQVIHYGDLSPYTELMEYPISKEKELYERLKNTSNKQEISACVSEYYESLLRGGPIAINHLFELTIRLLAGIEKRMLIDTKTANTNMRHAIMSVTRMETLQEVERFVSAYFADLRVEMQRHEKESHRSIIQKTIVFMEMECQSATLDSVAKKVYMTPTYLSMLFKVNTGKTFIEQLTDIRMDKAKEMLRSTYLKNYEVAEKVGYRDSRYFSQIFKKKVGLSPSEYRESAVR